MLRAAGEPTRLRILALLAREELAVMEISQALDQSQPRVSRHLKLLTEAGLIERFPDGAWAFYRLSSTEPARRFIDQILGLAPAQDPLFRRDGERLEAVWAGRSAAASAYFARNAGRWDEIRSLYVAEHAVEAAILDAAGPGPYRRLVDLGAGAGHMLTLLGPRAEQVIGLDLSQQMLNIARDRTQAAGLARCELRHGDIFATGLAEGFADRVVVHQVLHYLSDPHAAVVEAARITAPGGRLLIVDFAPHALEFLRASHQHRRLGFAEAEIARWMGEAGLTVAAPAVLPPDDPQGLTVVIWRGVK
jgi:ubiquinone/menaquinone biosynthesis C-methylase UbiE/DNA-binding transcriptional ArsR family regulator